MALSKEALGSGKWKSLRLRVLARDGWQCTYCHKDLKGADATVDHITSRKVGGSVFDMDNLTSACKSCNSRKGSRFFSSGSTPPAFRFKISPIGSNQSKSVQNGHTTIHVDADSPFISPGQPGAN